MGGGSQRASNTNCATPRSPTPAPPSPPAPLFRHTLRPPPSFLRRQEPPPLPATLPLPNSSLPPPRGEVRWGVEANEPATPIAPRPDRPPPALRHPCCAPLRHINALSVTTALPSATPTPSLRHRHALSVTTALPSVTPTPSPATPAPPFVIPAQAGTHAASAASWRRTLGAGAEAAQVGRRRIARSQVAGAAGELSGTPAA